MISEKEFIHYIFLSNQYDIKSIEYAIWNSNISIVKYLFDMKNVQDRFKDNDALIFRLLIRLFAQNSNSHLTDYVLSILQITKEKVIEMLTYKYPEQGESGVKYYKLNILTSVVNWGTFKHLQTFIAVIGQQVFIDNVFNTDGLGWDAMGYAVMKKKNKVIEYILS